MELTLEKYKITDFSVNNRNLPDGEHTVRFSYDTAYSHPKPGKYAIRCTGKLVLDEADNKEGKDFSVELTMNGYFSYKGDFSGEDNTTAACEKELLPLMRSHISSAMASIGMPPIVIPLSKIV